MPGQNPVLDFGIVVVILLFTCGSFKMKGKDLDPSGCRQVGDLSLIHPCGGIWIVVTDRTGIGYEKNQSRLIRCPVKFVKGCLEPGKGIFVKGMGGDFGFLCLGQGEFKLITFASVPQIRQHPGLIEKTRRFAGAVAVGHQSESDLIGQSGFFNGIINFTNGLTGPLNVWFHGNSGIDDEDNGCF